MTRRPLAATAAASLLLTLASPATAATTDTVIATASSSSVPLRVDTAALAMTVGENGLVATTDDDVVAGAPWSVAGVTLANIGGARLGEVAVASDGTTSAPGTSIDEPTALGEVSASVAQLLAMADTEAGTATASLGTVDALVNIVDGVEIGVTITDALAHVEDAHAAATHTLAFTGIDFGLAALLDQVLDGLPLDVLVDLADQFGVPVPADLDAADDVVAAIDGLVAAVTGADAAGTAVADAAAALLAAEALDPLADYGDIATYETMATDVAALVPDGDVGQIADALAYVTALLLDADFLALGCTVADPGVDLVQAVDDVATCLTDHLLAYADAVAALATPLAALLDAVDDYLAAVAAASDAAGVLAGNADALDAITGLIGDLLALLGDVDILALSEIDVSQSVLAVSGDSEASHATNSCTVGALTALAQPSVPVAGCSASTAVTDAIALINGAIGQVLDTVGGVDAGDGVQLSIFDTAARSVQVATDGTTTATSHVELLELTIPDITVTPCDVADGLVCALGLDLTGTLGDALTAIDGVLTTAQTTVTEALATVDTLLTTLGQTVDVSAADGVQAVVDAAIATLNAVLDGLDLGALGTAEGVTVPGLSLTVDPELQAEHLVIAGDPAPAPDPDPAPEGDPTLPNTGGGAVLLAVLALGVAGALARRRRVGTE